MTPEEFAARPEIIRYADIPKQTELVEDGKIGDCWRCCIAAILGLPAAAVPHFLAEALKGNSPCMDTLTQQWLNPRGYWLLNCKPPVYAMHMFGDDIMPPPIITCGPTPRSKKIGQHHAVVMVDHKLVYDPHPSNAGLTAITDCHLVMPHYPARLRFYS